MTDFAVKKLAISCPNLEYVNLSGCKYVSSSSIETLTSTCSNIYHLNLTRLPKLTEKPFDSISKLPKLAYLNLYADGDIQDQGF
mmetsp:Transcript_7168/g.6263  ORF Transcript_7168/g.6263 Transcript_7168/m.6263 type:complete len:84 (+) Transcript_7168:408-659(+)